MMNTVSMRLPPYLLQEADRRAAELKMNRAEYIRHAVVAMNRAVEEEQRKTRLRSASLKVRSESMKVNAQFAAVEHAPD